jgi:hypothetical protein
MVENRILPATRYRRKQDLLDRQLSDGFVVYDPETERVHVLNESARFVWSHCDGSATTAQIVTGVIESAGRPPADAAEDVYRALTRFLAEGLIAGL